MEMSMKKTKFAIAVAALLLAGTALASAATVKGRITMIDEKNHQLAVDNNEVYSVAPSVDLSALGVGSEAQLEVSGRAGAQTVTAAKKTD